MTVKTVGKLSGKHAIVTGGSRGIGAAIAQAFVAEGATVALVHHRDHDHARSALEALQAVNKNCLALDCDVADPQQVQSCVDTVVRQFGGADILVNSAGIGGGAPFEEMTLEVWNLVMSVNLTGTFLMSWACYPRMKAQHSGRIINIASQMAFSGGIGAGTAYCASKAGVVGFTRALAIEAAQYGVLVNGIAPGATMTDMLKNCGEKGMAQILSRIPLGRFAEPHEIAATAVMLASDDGSFYVGQTLSPNGGDVLR